MRDHQHRSTLLDLNQPLQLVFLLILAAGFVFVWARGDLEWVRPKPEIPVLNRKIFKDEVIKDQLLKETKTEIAGSIK